MCSIDVLCSTPKNNEAGRAFRSLSPTDEVFETTTHTKAMGSIRIDVCAPSVVERTGRERPTRTVDGRAARDRTNERTNRE